jgi:hypothetical protein
MGAGGPADVLTRIDRLALAVPDRTKAAEGWVALLGAEPAGEDRVACLGARRSRYRLGRGWVELLEPDGAGPVADAVAKRGGHLFAAGAATRDVEGVAARLREGGLEPVIEAGQAHVDAGSAIPGLRMVVSGDERLELVGHADFLYEVTLLVSDAPAAVERFAALFGLEAAGFVPIESEQYGYRGALTLFDADRLDRLEVITPTDAKKTMGRFFDRFGPCFYMAFAESPALGAIEERALELGLGFTAEPPLAKRELPDGGERRSPHTLFLHPPALGGTMLGLSRPTLAWQWSGHPERVERAR